MDLKQNPISISVFHWLRLPLLRVPYHLVRSQPANPILRCRVPLKFSSPSSTLVCITAIFLGHFFLDFFKNLFCLLANQVTIPLCGLCFQCLLQFTQSGPAR